MKSGVRLARFFFSVVSLGLVANALLIQHKTALDTRFFIVFLQAAIVVLSFLDWHAN
jgi:hypothetical protein